MRHTKIIATVGPACDTDAHARRAHRRRRRHLPPELFARHARVAGARRSTASARAAARAGREVAILQDLGGPKIRTGHARRRHADSARGRRAAAHRDRRLRRAARPHLDHVRGPRAQRSSPATACCSPTASSSCGRVDRRHGDPDDGRRGRRARRAQGHQRARRPAAASAITPKDVDDLQVRPVARRGHGRAQLRADRGRPDAGARADGGRRRAGDVPLVAKLERPQALEHLDEILASCDGVMVARGDLGLEMPLERVPRGAEGDHAPRPASRHPGDRRDAGARVDDDRAAADARRGQRRGQRRRRRRRRDHAGGRDGGRRVSRRAPCRRSTRSSATPSPAGAAAGGDAGRPWRDGDHAQALCEAAVTLANRSDAQAIVAVTRGGNTARRLSALRPHAPIIAATDDEVTARRLSLYWGVTARPDGDWRGRGDGAGLLIGQELVGPRPAAARCARGARQRQPGPRPG